MGTVRVPPAPTAATPISPPTVVLARIASLGHPVSGGAHHLRAAHHDGCRRRVGQCVRARKRSAGGAYPSLFRGCHWSDCTSNSGMPIGVANLVNTGTVTATFRTGASASGAWDDAFDIWFNPDTSTSNNLTGLEVMVWLTHRGAVQP